jgi:hypothetical protein
VIALRSVLSDFRLSGKVNLPEGYDYRGLDVWMSLKSAKDEPPREVFLFNLPARPTKPAAVEPEASASPGAKVPPKSPPGTKPAAPASREPETAEFSLRLPTLEKGQSYHFQFTAASRQTGSLLYQHSYEIGEKNQKPLEISFLAAPTGIEVEGEEENAISTKPEFAWQPVTGAEYYRVLLEAGTPPENKVIWEAWTKTPRIAYPLESSTGQLKEQEVYTLSVAAIKGLKPVFKNSKTLYAHPGYQAIWTELSSLTHQPFEVVKPES